MSGGGNETPRQKMIGMMYLVLTALLALQTSSSVLEKFIFIDEALHEAANEVATKNAATLSAITAKVADKGNRVDDMKALDKAKEVRELTKETLEHLDKLRQEFAIITGGGDPDGYDDVTGQLIGSKDFDIVGHYMINEKHGEELAEELNGYAAKLSTLAGGKFEPLAKDAKDLAIAKDDPNQNMKDFSEYYFEHTPTAAGMATISHMESEVLRYELKALEDIAELVGAKDVDFDQIVPLIKPRSSSVAAGAKFYAELYITASASGLDPKFRYNGKEAPQSATPQGIKFGVIEFTANASKFDANNVAKASFEAEIELNDSIYKIPYEYEVVKPVIQVRSAAASALYMNCGNELNIQVPSLGTDYAPAFSSPDATTIKGSKTGFVTVVPTGRSKVDLTVSSGGNKLGVETFTVKKPPLPTFSFKSGGKEVDMKNGAQATSMRSLDVTPEAEENFAREVPKDAEYRIRQLEITLARGSRPVTKQSFTTQKLNLAQFVAQARPGDRLVVEIKQVTRKTYQGKNEPVQLRNAIFNIPLN